MLVVILLYDQLLFRPLVAWSDKFRFETTAAIADRRSPGCSSCCGARACCRAIAEPFGAMRSAHLQAAASASGAGRGAMKPRAARAAWIYVWSLSSPHRRLAAWQIVQLSSPATLQLAAISATAVLTGLYHRSSASWC